MLGISVKDNLTNCVNVPVYDLNLQLTAFI